MDPVTAVQVAGTALSLVSFGLDTLELYRQIRNNVSGATKANEELEAATKTMKSLMTDLGSSAATGTGTKSQLSQIAADSVASCDELLKVLQDVRGPGSSGSIGRLKSTYKATTTKRKVEKLRETLSAKQDLLKLTLDTDLRSLVKSLDTNQQQMQIDLSHNIQAITTQLQSQQALSSTSAQEIQQTLTKILAETAATHQAVVNGQQNIRNDVTDLRADMVTGFNQLSVKSAREELLNSLFFPEHTLRRDQLKDAYGETFSWILHEEELFDSSRKRQWDSLPEWLESESGLYWISGKLGSGKSTLMAYILDAEATSTYLQKWASGKKLLTPSFFFWRPGTPLQRSLEGLLRSLMIQLLDKMPDGENTLLTELLQPAARRSAWTEKTLRSMLERTLRYTHAEGHSACIFIDGLDEFEGQTEELLQLLFSLKDFSGVKICVASRPEPALKRGLASFAHLRLEDLNYLDILELASGRLVPCVGPLSIFEVDSLRRSISSQAEGVFLWAVLVTNSVREGALAGDSKTTLEEMIEDTPSDITELFRTMLEGTKKTYRKSLAYYVKALKFASEWDFHMNVSLFAACKPDVEPAQYNTFVEACARMVLEIENRSNGLLAVHGQPLAVHNQLAKDRAFEPMTNRSGIWRHETGRVCCDIRDQNRPDMHALSQDEPRATPSCCTSTAKDRLRTLDFRTSCLGFTTALRMAQYDEFPVDWVHRSVHDFFFGGDSDVATSVLNLMPNEDVAVSLAEGLMKHLPACPTWGTLYPNCLAANIRRTCHCILKMHAELGDGLLAYLNELDAMMRKCRWCELHPLVAQDSWSWDDTVQMHVFRDSRRNETEHSIRAYQLHLLWEDCASYGAFGYLRQHFDEMLSYPAGAEYLSSAILYCVSGLYSFQGDDALSHYEFNERFNVAEEGLRILKWHFRNRSPHVLDVADLSTLTAELLVTYDVDLRGEDVESTLGYDQLVWLPPEGLSDTQYRIELETVTNLACTMRFCMLLLVERRLRDRMEPTDLETLYKLLGLVSSILNTWSLFFAIPGLKYEHEGWREDGSPILWWDDFEEQSSSIVMLCTSAPSYLAYALSPLVPEKCNGCLREILEDQAPTVLAIYRVAVGDEELHREPFYTVYDSASNVVVGAVYLLDRILSQRILGGTEAVINETPQDLKERIELNPQQPHGMLKMLYRMTKHPRLA